MICRAARRQRAAAAARRPEHAPRRRATLADAAARVRAVGALADVPVGDRLATLRRRLGELFWLFIARPTDTFPLLGWCSGMPEVPPSISMSPPARSSPRRPVHDLADLPNACPRSASALPAQSTRRSLAPSSSSSPQRVRGKPTPARARACWSRAARAGARPPAHRLPPDSVARRACTFGGARSVARSDASRPAGHSVERGVCLSDD